MNKFTLKLVAASLAAAFSLAAFGAQPGPKATLKPFASEAELEALLKGWVEERKKREDDRRARMADSNVGAMMSQAAPAAPAPAAKAASGNAASESVTNVQHAGVDEGGIVKVIGDFLVVLRRGRLFSVAIGDRELKPVAFADAFAGSVQPGGAWYDEMLVHGNTVVVIGYSYARGGTEIGLFELSGTGEFRHKSTHHLRSNDYYSSRNYASRLIGSKLVFYTPLFLNLHAADPFAGFPAMRKWRDNATPADFRRIAPATRIYRTDEPLDPWQGVALHTVTVCDLAAAEMDCKASAVMGPAGRVFYVAPESVYVWTSAWRQVAQNPGAVQAPSSAVFRIPLDGAAPSALKVAGSPVDQFSFLESEGLLNVLVRSNGRGDGMWAAEVNSGDLALARLPLGSFSDGRESAPASAYTPLPKVGPGAFQNRYVGNYLLFGSGAGWRRPQANTSSEVFAVKYANPGVTYGVPLVHGVDRIEAIGNDAVVVGSDGKDLHFTGVRLKNYPVAAGRYTRENAAQGETRSHGFFYKPENEQAGLLGLPIIGSGRAASGQLRRESASLLFLRNESLGFSELGALASRPDEVGRNDGCRASCVDWYGNSRPLFLRNRVFALLGYELVEGTLGRSGIVEARRVNFAPKSGDYGARIGALQQPMIAN